MDQLYREQIIDHYKNPRNQADDSQIEAMTSWAELKNLSCGDEIKLGVNIKDNKIKDIKFKGTGCAVCISAASIISEELIAENISEVKNYTYEDLTEIVGYEPSPSRIKCLHLGLLTLQEALTKLES
ncbi:iron-sulfur cluster assembly scaffold protein [Candidatus Dojkabacteria bacterium]|nr:iron-sulfur cluster assembly scaffold protein [Candidatus Dojkabacteria bacterium]